MNQKERKIIEREHGRIVEFLQKAFIPYCNRYFSLRIDLEIFLGIANSCLWFDQESIVDKYLEELCRRGSQKLISQSKISRDISLLNEKLKLFCEECKMRIPIQMYNHYMGFDEKREYVGFFFACAKEKTVDENTARSIISLKQAFKKLKRANISSRFETIIGATEKDDSFEPKSSSVKDVIGNVPDMSKTELMDLKESNHKMLNAINMLLSQKSGEQLISQLEDKLEKLSSSLIDDSSFIAEKIERLIKNRDHGNIELLIQNVLLFSQRAKQTGNISEEANNRIEAKISKMRGILFLEKQNYEKAVEQFEYTLSLNPKDYEAKLNIAFALYSIGRYDDAIRAYDELIFWQPDNYEAYHQKAILLAKITEHGKAVDCYKRVLELKPDSYSAWMSLAVSFNAIRQYTEALESVEKAIAIDPGKGEFWALKGIICLSLYKDEDAYKSFKKAEQLIPQHSALIGLTSLLGIASFVMGNFEDSCILLQKATKEDPEDYDTWYHYAASLYFSERYEEAIEAVNRCFEGKKEFLGMWVVKGFSEMMLKKYEDAINSFQKAKLYCDKPLAELLTRFGFCLKEAGNLKEAAEVLEESVDVDSNQSTVWYILGETYYKLRNYPKSLIAFNNLLKSDPESYEALIYKSQVLDRLNLPQDSLDVLKHAIEISPRRIEAYLKIGAKLSVFERYKSAIPYFRRMIYENPNEVKWYIILAALIKRRGKNFESHGLLRVAKELFPQCLEEIVWLINSSTLITPFAIIYAKLVQNLAIIKYNWFMPKSQIESLGKLKW